MNMFMQIFKKTQTENNYEKNNYENKTTEELLDFYAQNKNREQIRSVLYKRHYHDFYPYKMWNYSQCEMYKIDQSEAYTAYISKTTEELLEFYKQNKDREQIRSVLYKRHYHDFYPYKMWNYSQCEMYKMDKIDKIDEKSVN